MYRRRAVRRLRPRGGGRLRRCTGTGGGEFVIGEGVALWRGGAGRLPPARRRPPQAVAEHGNAGNKVMRREAVESTTECSWHNKQTTSATRQGKEQSQKTGQEQKKAHSASTRKKVSMRGELLVTSISN